MFGGLTIVFRDAAAGKIDVLLEGGDVLAHLLDAPPLLVEAVAEGLKENGLVCAATHIGFDDCRKDLDAVAAKSGRTRNEIIAMSLEFALENIEILDKEK